MMARLRPWMLALGLLGGHGVAARAETVCTPPDFRGLQQCTSGVQTVAIDANFQSAAAPVAQLRSQWCWAASISMAFAQHGYQVPQQRIVADTFGDLRNWPGQGTQIQQAVNRAWTDETGRSFRAHTRVFDLQSGQVQISSIDILRELDAGRPLIYGAQGHATLLTAVQYIRQAQGGGFQIVAGTVRDPWPGRGRRQLQPQELSPFFVATVETMPLGRAPAPGGRARREGD